MNGEFRRTSSRAVLRSGHAVKYMNPRDHARRKKGTA